VIDPIDYSRHWSDYGRCPIMTQLDCSTGEVVWVAVDIAKGRNDVLAESPDGSRTGHNSWLSARSAW